MEPEHFLHKIDRPIEVVAPARDADRPGRPATLGRFLAHHIQFERLERGAHDFRRDVETEAFADKIVRDDHLALPRNIAPHPAGRAHDAAAGGFDDKIDCSIGRLQRTVRIDAPLVAVRRVGRQTQPAGGPADGLALEDRALKHQVGRIVAHSGIFPAHDAGDDHGAVRIGDDEHAAVQNPFLAIERDNLLPVHRRPDNDLVAPELAGIEGVQRLARLQHHVVANVDDIVDRAKSDRLKPRLHPRWARANLDPRDDMSRIKRAVLR